LQEENIWIFVEGYYPQLRTLAGIFPKASASSVVPVYFDNTAEMNPNPGTAVEKNEWSRYVQLWLAVPTVTSKDQAPVTWKWDPDERLISKKTRRAHNTTKILRPFPMRLPCPPETSFGFARSEV
jgi:hypothetical protein